MRRNLLPLLVLTAFGFFLTGCRTDQPTGVQDETAAQTRSTSGGTRTAAGDDTPELPPPNEFVAGIHNPYLGFAPGKVFRYEGETADGTETVVVEVTTQTKTILGVVATVVHDQGFLD